MAEPVGVLPPPRPVRGERVTVLLSKATLEWLHRIAQERDEPHTRLASLIIEQARENHQATAQ